MNLVFSGPSGSGKGTITEKLLSNRNFKKFITCTTRMPRETERNGVDYFFLDEDQFKKYVDNNKMFNIREYDGHYYGSFEEDIDNIKTDSILIFQLTPDRALEMKRNNSDTCLILILPPSVSELDIRRKNRSLKRIEDDIDNLSVAKQFDYVGVIIGNDLKYRGGKVEGDFSSHGSADPSFKGIKKLYKQNYKKADAIADSLIKNAYRVLLTRGIKGCYIYCDDEPLREHLKSEISKITK